MKSTTFLLYWAWITFLSAVLGVSGVPDGSASLVEAISAARIFPEPILWVGETPPHEKEALVLWQVLERISGPGGPVALQSLEQYLLSETNSPWEASVRANLGFAYRQIGRYSRALEHWERAWEATKSASTGNGKLVADYVLPHWTQLLCSLGRTETLEAVVTEAEGRKLAKLNWQKLFNQSRGALEYMRFQPGDSYRCGTLSLFWVAKVLGTNLAQAGRLLEIPSPASGFSLAALHSFAQTYQLGIIPCRRPPGAVYLCVPSVVHWKENHFAAIIGRDKDLYRVVDPTFGKPQWLSADAINAEASGWFMVPEGQVPSGWERGDPAQAAAVFGKGLNNASPEPEEPQCEAEEEETCCPPGPNGGPGPGGPSGACSGCSPPIVRPASASAGLPDGWRATAPSPQINILREFESAHLEDGIGIPTWKVSEPYTTLWLLDQPMAYPTSVGRQISLKLMFNPHDTKEDDTNIFNLGPDWGCNWLSYIDVEAKDTGPEPFAKFEAKLFGAGGGQRIYTETNRLNQYRNFTSFFLSASGSTIGTDSTVTYRNGSVWWYGLVLHVSSTPSLKKRLFLTEKHDPQNRIIAAYHYSTNNGRVLLTHVVDVDGRTNLVQYGTNVPSQIVQIQNPFGHTTTFQYDTNRMLTNITDVMGISSSFTYVESNGLPFISTLTTPYGDTRFTYINPDGNLFGQTPPDNINRAVTITEPNGATHLYMYRDDSWQLFRDGQWVDFIPNEYPTNDLPDIGIPVNTTNGLCNYHMYARNSFYWGPRQYALLSTTNIDQLTLSDYGRARLRNWLHQYSSAEPSVHTLGDALNLERGFSTDGTTEGPKTWYAYFGKEATGGLGSAWHIRGTNIFPSYTAQRLPDGRSYYIHRQHNHLGNVTLTAETHTTPSGTALRTNLLDYATDGIDLLRRQNEAGFLEGSFGYSGHKVATATNALNEVTIYTYSAAGLLTSVKSASGLTSTNVYDGAGFLQMAVEVEIGRTNSFTWTNGLIRSHTDERGLTRSYLYDALNRPVSVTNPDGSYSSNRYTYLDLTATRDPLGNWTYYGYNSVRQLIGITNALGNATILGYCTCGSLDSVTDALNGVTRYDYDAAGRRISTHYPDGSWITNHYNLVGQVTNTVDSAGTSVTNWYNVQGLLAGQTNSFGRVFYLEHDVRDQVRKRIDSYGVVTTNGYDALRRLFRTDLNGGTFPRSFTYSSNGLISVTYNSQTTWLTNDAAGRKVAERNPNGEVVNFQYDAGGGLTKLTDAKNQDTTWGYDQFGRVTNKTDHLGNTVLTYGYDANGRLTNRWSTAKGSTYYAYDALGNLTNVNYPSSPDLSFRYDALNRMTNLVDGVGTSSYSYGSMGQLLAVDGPWSGDTLNYGYTNLLRTSLSVASDGSFPSYGFTYGYDAIKRLSTITGSPGPFSYAYAASSAAPYVRRISLPNNAYVTNGYEGQALIVEATLKNGLNASLDFYSYYRSGEDLIDQVTRLDGSTVDFLYDPAGQLISAVGMEEGGPIRSHENVRYVYDGAGNLHYRTNNALLQTFTVNVLNQLTNATRSGTLTVAGIFTGSPTNIVVDDTTAAIYGDGTFAGTNFSLADGTNFIGAEAWDAQGRHALDLITLYLPATVSYAYDANGNLLTDGRRFFEWDDENQLITVVVTNTTKSVFAYDGKMRRRLRKEYVWQNSAWRQTGEVRYLYDGNLVVQERHYDPRITTNQPQSIVTYSRGLDLSGTLEGAGGIGGLLARTEFVPATLASSTAYYHSDGNGNVSALMDQSQNLVARYLYDPFGNVIAKSGSLAEANAYRFSSKEWHEPSGLVYYLYRFYEPNLQRWPNRDPLGEEGFEALVDRPNQRIRSEDAANLYLFVENRPATEIDPFGLFLGFGYGNHCGYSRWGDEDGIDDVDNACKKHDECLKNWKEACKFKFCNVRFCKDVAKAKCHGDKACKKAKRKILTGCALIVPIPPFIFM